MVRGYCCITALNLGGLYILEGTDMCLIFRISNFVVDVTAEIDGQREASGFGVLVMALTGVIGVVWVRVLASRSVSLFWGDTVL